MPDGSNFIPQREINHAELRPFLSRLIRVAGDIAGNFVVCGFGEAPGTFEKHPPGDHIHVVPNGPAALAGMVAAVESINQVPGLNAYVSIGLFKPREQWVNPVGRGSEADLIGTMVFVGDFDGKHDPTTYRERLPLRPHVTVATSAENRQPYVFLDKPYPVDEAKPVFEALTNALGTDSTFSCEHVFRPPGTWNWPTKKKVQSYGRSLEPQLAKVADKPIKAPGFTIGELRAATLAKYPHAFDNIATGTPDDLDWDAPRPRTTFREMPPDVLKGRLGATTKADGVPIDRSSAAFAVIEALANRGYTPNQIEKLLSAHLELSVMDHYTDKGDGCEAAVQRDIAKAFTTKNPNAKRGAEMFGDAGKHGDALHMGDQPGLVLSPASPLKSARKFVERHYTTTGGMRALVRWRDDWLSWTGTHYRSISDAGMTAELYRFLEAARVKGQSNGDGEPTADKPFNPDQGKVNKVLHALAAEAYHPDDIEAPTFRSGGDSYAEVIGLQAGDLVACRNGLIHLPTRTLAPHEPGFFNLNSLDFAFDPQATAPRWQAFLDSILPGDPEAIATLQEIFGYIVSGETRLQKLFGLFGPGRSGKGTIVKVMERLLGEQNCKPFTFKQLAQPHGMQDFPGKSLLVIQDAHLGKGDPGGAVESLKMISAADRITVSRKYKSDWHGVLPGRILIVSNNRLRLDDDSGVIATRTVPIRLATSFLGRENVHLLSELIPELPGMFNWALVGWERVMARGDFIVPASAQEIVDDIRSGASPITDFIEDCCDLGPVEIAEKSRLRSAWDSWRQLANMKPTSPQEFGRMLSSAVPTLTSHRGERRGTRERFRYYRGIRLRGAPEVLV